MIRIVAEAKNTNKEDYSDLNQCVSRLSIQVKNCNDPSTKKAGEALVKGIKGFVTLDFIGSLSPATKADIGYAIDIISSNLMQLDSIQSPLLNGDFLTLDQLKFMIFNRTIIQQITRGNPAQVLSDYIHSIDGTAKGIDGEVKGNEFALCSDLQQAITQPQMKQVDIIPRPKTTSDDDNIRKVLYDELTKSVSGKGGVGMYTSGGKYERLIAAMLSVGKDGLAKTSQKSPDVIWNGYQIEVKNNSENPFNLYLGKMVGDKWEYGIDPQDVNRGKLIGTNKYEIDYFGDEKKYGRSAPQDKRKLVVIHDEKADIFSNTADVLSALNITVLNAARGSIECTVK